ncbi:MAG: flagellar export chaperone FlgN [Phycisphaeraceae bacterium]|nr:flagellar export chaperone FlgN [Phycisphaeraceae bacterium]
MSAAPATSSRPDHAAMLSAHLDALISAHSQWLELTREHRAAIAQADPRRLELCTARQRELTTRIAEIETQRQSTVRAIVQASPEGRARSSGAPPRIQELLPLLPLTIREEIAEKANRLTDAMVRIRAEQQSLRLAASSLAAHVEGLVRHVTRRLSGHVTYAPRGPAPSAPAAALDITR